MRTERELLKDFEDAVRTAEGALAGAVLIGEELGFTPSRVIDEIEERATGLCEDDACPRQERLPFWAWSR